MIAGKCFMQMVSVTFCHQDIVHEKNEKNIFPSFCLHKSKWWKKRNWLHLLLYCCVLPILTERCQALAPLWVSHRSSVLSRRDSRYWCWSNSHTTVSAEYILSIITLFNNNIFICFCPSLRGARCEVQLWETVTTQNICNSYRDGF